MEKRAHSLFPIPLQTCMQTEGWRAAEPHWWGGREDLHFCGARGKALSTALLVPRGLWENIVPQTCGLAREQSLYMKWEKVHHLQVNTACLGNGEWTGFQLPQASWA